MILGSHLVFFFFWGGGGPGHPRGHPLPRKEPRNIEFIVFVDSYRLSIVFLWFLLTVTTFSVEVVKSIVFCRVGFTLVFISMPFPGGARRSQEEPGGGRGKAGNNQLTVELAVPCLSPGSPVLLLY